MRCWTSTPAPNCRARRVGRPVAARTPRQASLTRDRFFGGLGRAPRVGGLGCRVQRGGSAVQVRARNRRSSWLANHADPPLLVGGLCVETGLSRRGCIPPEYNVVVRPVAGLELSDDGRCYRQPFRQCIGMCSRMDRSSSMRRPASSSRASCSDPPEGPCVSLPRPVGVMRTRGIRLLVIRQLPSGDMASLEELRLPSTTGRVDVVTSRRRAQKDRISVRHMGNWPSLLDAKTQGQSPNWGESSVSVH